MREQRHSGAAQRSMFMAITCLDLALLPNCGDARIGQVCSSCPYEKLVASL